MLRNWHSLKVKVKFKKSMETLYDCMRVNANAVSAYSSFKVY